MHWIHTPCPKRDPHYRARAIQRQSQLTKPAGSLGTLETVAIRLADLQQQEKPAIENIAISIFAADHGVVKEGVSAFPQSVTAQMVENFLNGGAAISVLARLLSARLEVVDVGILTPANNHADLISHRAGAGTANCSHEPAMTREQLEIALQAGFDSIERARKINNAPADLFIGGEMGIGNTTTASALYCALLGLSPEQTTGAGTGLDNKGIHHKITVVKQILATHQSCGDNTLAWLRCAGGFEIAALTGAYIHAARSGMPVLVDGFISSVAALCASRLNEDVAEWLFFSHVSGEQGHRKVLDALQQTALLDLEMRLGEGSGAAVAVPLMQAACTLHNRMATFDEAAVANKQ
jgi:nicotinate-nucleotide--dimethylbenzimidazole phosphoribosyltransferase